MNKKLAGIIGSVLMLLMFGTYAIGNSYLSTKFLRGYTTKDLYNILIDFETEVENDNLAEKTPVNAVASEGLITMTGVATGDETFVIDSQTFTWKASRSGAGEVTIGDTADSAVTNIVTAVTADLATVTAADGAGSTVEITAVTKGVAGDSIVFTEDSDNMAVDGAGTLGTAVAGVDGTVGVANETCADGSYLYHCITTNTVADTNWRRVSIGAAY